jgi:molybdenum cofactor cytidylyltransferase
MNVTLLDVLQVRPGMMVSFVGGGGKTSAMFRLAGQIVQAGGRVITTTTTRIFAAQTRLAPVHVQSPGELAAASERHAHILYTGPVNETEGKAYGIAPDEIDELKSRFGDHAILVEADGSRMRPFKAPAAHEPVIPLGSDIVIAVVGMDAVGLPLTDKYVHRPELIAAIHPGATVTVEMVAAVLRHPAGGMKNAPSGARVLALINKVEHQNREAAEHLADLLVARGGMSGAILASIGRSNEVYAARYAAS